MNITFKLNRTIDAIFRHYHYDPLHFNDSIRQSALLYRKIFANNTIVVDGTTFNITDNLRLHLLVSGIIYSLRNDSLHGSSMSSTKSSKTTPKRYAMNYYCYLATYTLLMLLLVDKSTMPEANKNSKYAELKNITYLTSLILEICLAIIFNEKRGVFYGH